MSVCTSCGAQNSDGAKFCVKCGAALAPAAPAPGSWRASGDLRDNQPSAGLNNPVGSYVPPPVPYPAYSTPQSMMANQMNYAPWGDRVLGALIDGALAGGVMIVLYLIFLIVGGVFTSLAGIGGSAGSAANAFGSSICCVGFVLAPLSFLIIGIYNKIYLVSTRGFSIGQGIMNMKVVDAQGNLISMGTAALRLLVQLGLGIVPFLGFFLELLNLLFPLWDPQRQTLHDKAVGTFVVKTQ